MWFCCQLIQCNVKSCFGPIDIWKTWHGWSHVVYPSKTTTTSKNFGERAANEENAGRQSILLQRPVAVRTTEKSLSQHDSNVYETNSVPEKRPSCSKLAGGLHLSGGQFNSANVSSSHMGNTCITFRVPNRRGAARIRQNSAASCSSRASLRSTGSRRERRGPSSVAGGSCIEHAGTPPAGVKECQPRRESRCDSGGERINTKQLSGSEDSGMVLQTDSFRNTAELDLGLSVTIEGSLPLRTPSTEWTPLESSLDFWSQEHLRHRCYFPRDDEDDTQQRCKVRYNDTGSLEEVNVEDMVEYYVEDEELGLRSEGDRENLRMQYRQLWELRATFEDEEYMSDDAVITFTPQLHVLREEQSSQPTSKLSEQQSVPEQQPTSTESLEKEPTKNRSSFDQSADTHESHWTQLLHLPSYESRRQTYKNILTSRLRGRMQEARGRQYTQDDISLDSLETVDTEGSSTDVSRLEQATTSFESTTDNTDSTGDSQVHKLHQIRADSGYRSFETPSSRPPKLHRHSQFQFAESGELEELVTTSEQELEEADEGHVSPPQATVSISSVHGKLSSCPNHQSSSYSRSASKKRHEFGRDCHISESKYFESVYEVDSDSRSGNESHDESCGILFPTGLSTAAATVVTTTPSGRVTKTVLLPRYLRHGSRYSSAASLYAASIPQRDYSVDEKSDALFREFSRCDPIYDPPESNRQRFHYRRMQHRTSQSAELEPEHHRRSKLTPQGNIGEQFTISNDRSEEVPPDIPIIRVADEDAMEQL